MTLSPQVAALFQPYPTAPAVHEPAKRIFRRQIGRHMTLLHRMVICQGKACAICGDRLQCEGMPAGRIPTFDHVVPRSRGGGNHRNKIAVHLDCNNRKADRMPSGCELLMLDVVNTRVVA